MAVAATAEIEVEIPRAKVAAEVAASARQIEQGLGGAARKVESEFAQTARSVATGFLAFKGAQFFNEAIQAASNLEQAVGATDAVFGEASAVIDEFAANSVEKFGLSERAFREAVTPTGAMIQALGFTADEAARLAAELAGLAADFSATYGGTTANAIQAVNAAIRGEFDTIEQYGIKISAANVEREALESGLAATKGQITDNAKAQATLNLILGQGARVSGQFASEADTLAVKQQKANAEFENAKAELGEGLQPAMKAATDIAIDLTKAFAALPQPLQLATVGTTAAATAVALLAPAFSRASLAVRGWVASQAAAAPAAATSARSIDGQTAALMRNQAAATAATSRSRAMLATFAGGAAATAGVGLAIFGLTRVLAEQTEQAQAAERELEEYEARVTSLTNTLTGASSISAGLDQIISQFVGDNPNVLQQLGIDAPTLKAELDKGAASFQAFLRNLNYQQAQGSAPGTGLTADTSAALSQLSLNYDDAKVAADAYKATQEALTGTTSDSAAAQTAQTAEIEKAREALDTMRDAEAEVAGSKRDALVAYDEFQRAQRAAVGDSDDYRRALKDIESAERDLARANRDVQRAQEDLTDARKRAAETLEDLRFAAEGSALSQERAQLRLQDAIEEERRVLGDPSSTARERAEASLSRREAELALREAQDRAGDSASELAEAERRGVEGSDEVVAAREAVASALDSQRDAAQRVADAEKAAADVIAEAKARAMDAYDALGDALLAQAEAEGVLAEAQGGVTDGINAEIDALDRLASTLDPASPVRQRLNEFRDDLEELRRVMFPAEIGLQPGVGAGMTGTIGAYATPEPVPGPFGIPASPWRGRSVTQNFFGLGLDEKTLAEKAGKAASDSTMWGD